MRILGIKFPRFPQVPSSQFASFLFFNTILFFNVLKYAVPYAFIFVFRIVFKAFETVFPPTESENDQSIALL